MVCVRCTLQCIASLYLQNIRPKLAWSIFGNFRTCRLRTYATMLWFFLFLFVRRMYSKKKRYLDLMLWTAVGQLVIVNSDKNDDPIVAGDIEIKHWKVPLDSPLSTLNVINSLVQWEPIERQSGCNAFRGSKTNTAVATGKCRKRTRQ